MSRLFRVAAAFFLFDFLLISFDAYRQGSSVWLVFIYINIGLTMVQGVLVTLIYRRDRARAQR